MSDTTTTINNPRQTTLKEIAKELKEFDFKSFDARKDKVTLMNQLQSINARLGKLLKGYA